MSYNTPVHSVSGSAVGAIGSGRAIGGTGAVGAIGSGRSIGGIGTVGSGGAVGGIGAVGSGGAIGGAGAVGAIDSGRAVVGAIVYHIVCPVNDVFHNVGNDVPGRAVAAVGRAAACDTVDVGVISGCAGCIVVSGGSGT